MGVSRQPMGLLLCSWCLAGSLAGIMARPRPPIDLAVNDRVDPIGIGGAAPRFSWLPQDSAEGAMQGAYRIRVASSSARLKAREADCWDSGKVSSSAVAGIPYQGRPLRSREIYYWQVRTWNALGEPSDWSSVARFEIGLMSNEDWNTAWIWRNQQKEAEDYVYLRKTAVLPDKRVVRARVYLSASHRHELYVNGALVGKGPNFAYPEFQYYQTFDLANFLKPGQRNALAVLCHWYGAGQGRPYSRAGLLLRTVVEFDDGTSLILGSDRTWKSLPAEWKVPPGKPSGKNFRNGEGVPAELTDGRRHPLGWGLPGFDDSQWESAVELGFHPTPPWTGPLIAQETSLEEYEIPPVQVNRLGVGHFLADFGKVYAGMPKITFKGGQAGEVVKIKADYRVRPDGTLDGFAQSTRMDYEYTLRGGEETFRPYWYLGFRYVEVENAPSAFDGELIRLIVRHNRVNRDASSFECSHGTLNAIWELVKRSIMLGSQEQFVDTPTREQGQFTYDAYQISAGAMRCFGERLLSRQGLREFAQSQTKFHLDSGKVNAVYPNGDGKRDIPDWTQSWILWAWEYYLETGDREFVRELLEALLRTGEYVKRTENSATGLVDLGNSPGYAGGIVDWPERYEYDMTTTQRTVMSINAYLDYVWLARLARLVDSASGAADRFDGYAAEILSAIQRLLWDESLQAYVDGLYADGSRSPRASQQANAMMLALGLAEGSRKPGAMKAVKRAGHATGPVLARFLIQAYGEHDEDDALMEWLLNPQGRNFAYTLADGGTFTYEHWLGRNSGKSGESSESHAYGANAGVMALQQYILGVRSLAPQGERLQVRPHPCGLGFARGSVPLQRGTVSISWRTGEDFTMELVLPVNVVADVYVPAGKLDGNKARMDGRVRSGERQGGYILIKNVGAGRHVFSCP